jgi:hypothetical protein
VKNDIIPHNLKYEIFGYNFSNFVKGFYEDEYFIGKIEGCTS